MVSTAILLVQDATPNSITAFHDTISNELPKILGRWSFELKIFKSNTQTTQESSTFLYGVTLDHEQGKSITLVNKSAIITSSEIPRYLIDSGSSNGSHDNFDHIIQTKLQSLWLHRQTLKGDNGNSYEIHNGSFIVRPVNVFLHGSFKALLIEITYKGKGDGLDKIKELIEKDHFPKGKLASGRFNDHPNYLADLAYQYTEALK